MKLFHLGINLIMQMSLLATYIGIVCGCQNLICHSANESNIILWVLNGFFIPHSF